MKDFKNKAKHVALTTVFVVAMGAGVAAFADKPKVEDFKVRLTGVAVMPADDDAGVKPRVLPPQSRIVVQPGNLAVFYLDYSFPTNLQSRMYLGPNFDESVLGVRGSDPIGGTPR